MISQVKDGNLNSDIAGKGCSNEVLTATLQDTNSKVLDKVLVRMYGSNINGRWGQGFFFFFFFFF